MKKIFSLFLLITFLNLYSPVLAKTIDVKSGVRVPITVKSKNTSRHIIAGQKIDAIIEDDVKVNNILVFKKGDPATINISDVKKAGFLGNAGEMYLVNGEISDINGEKHLIEYNQKIIGDEKTYPKVLLGVSIFFLFPLALFAFVKGGQAELCPNKVIDVAVRNDFKFDTEKL